MDELERSLPGYFAQDLPVPKALRGTEDWEAPQWQDDFEYTRKRLVAFLAARDPLAILARTALRHIADSARPKVGVEELVNASEQVELEIAQALVLMGDSRRKKVPTSPDNFIKYWTMMSRHIHGFIRKQPKDDSSPIASMVRQKVRLQTLYYRNHFTKSDCESTLTGILKIIDLQSQSALGYRLSDLFDAMVSVATIVSDRFESNLSHLKTLMQSTSRAELLREIAFFRSQYPLADKAWRDREDRFSDLEELRFAGFQMSEMAWPGVFLFDRKDLELTLDKKIVDILLDRSIPFGGLANINYQHIYLNNPIWRKPYIKVSDDKIFAAIPQLIFSFPFAIIEDLIENHPILKRAYENARAVYLESQVADIVSNALPNAQVFRSVLWEDPETGTIWENDVVALLGNFVFVFEAKSGRLSEVARRGGDKSLKTNFRELFVEPGLQGWRLQNYLNTYKQQAALRLKSDSSPVDLQLDKPKAVYRYSISFEHFNNITSARFYFRELGLIENETAWAPALTLGEFQMLARFLDSEVSFQHYLTRRPSVDEIIDFDGDEQDILSMYIINGLWIDGNTLSDKKVIFLGADAPVRKQTQPRKDRTAVEAIGSHLSPIWLAIIRELYANRRQRHRYDIINVILNQLPPAMKEFEKRVRKFKRGVSHKGEDVLITKFICGNRTFVLACHLAKQPPDREEWQQAGRNIVAMFLNEDTEETIVECAMFLFIRRSKFATFDGVSFYRYGLGKKPKDIIK